MNLLLDLLEAILGILDLFKRPPVNTPDPPPSPDDDEFSPIELGLLAEHNVSRASAGVPKLALNKNLMQAARLHALWMRQNNTTSHTGRGGSSVGQRVTGAGYNWARVGENIAKGYTGLNEVMGAWMNSRGHKLNILNSSYTEAGFGVVGEGSNTYYCAVFATPSRIPMRFNRRK